LVRRTGIVVLSRVHPYEFLDRSRAYTLDGVAQRITCPVLVCQAADEHFNPGQAEKLAAALGDRATLRSFSAAESAAAHSHLGAFVLMNGVVTDWMAEMLSATKTNDRPEVVKPQSDH
jgi:hypothetical protein